MFPNAYNSEAQVEHNYDNNTEFSREVYDPWTDEEPMPSYIVTYWIRRKDASGAGNFQLTATFNSLNKAKAFTKGLPKGSKPFIRKVH
jgi:hypothetical protein